MGIVWEVVRNETKSEQFANLLLEFDKILGLDIKNSKEYLEKNEELSIPEEIKTLLEQRKIARDNKDWAESDRIRDEIKEKGYVVKDTKEGQIVSKS
jgi:cysteinyl-tRNA synthetase